MLGDWFRASCPAYYIPAGHRRRPRRRCAWPVFGPAHVHCSLHVHAACVASAAVHASCPDRRAPQHNPRRDHAQTETTPPSRCHLARGVADARACLRIEQHSRPLPYISKIDENRRSMPTNFAQPPKCSCKNTTLKKLQKTLKNSKKSISVIFSI